MVDIAKIAGIAVPCGGGSGTFTAREKGEEELRLRLYQEELSSSFGVTAVVAAEIEWYLRPPLQEERLRRIDSETVKDSSSAMATGGDGFLSRCSSSGDMLLHSPWKSSYADIQEYFATLSDRSVDAGLELHSLSQEDGAGQVEAALMPTADLDMLADNLSKLRELAAESALVHNIEADFSAKPFRYEYGSGMHIHIHLRDNGSGNNRFWKRGDDMSDDLRYSLAGLLCTMPKFLCIYAPDEASEKRFTPRYNAPINVSWGNNNRTVALRLPSNTGGFRGVQEIASSAYSYDRRIEHRVAGANASPRLVIASVLAGVIYGLREKPTLPPPIYGDASDEQYQLEPFFSA